MSETTVMKLEMGAIGSYDGMRFDLDGNMMPGGWMAYDDEGRAIGSGVIGVGEHWNGDKKDVRSFKMSAEVYGALIQHAARPS